MPVRCRVCDAVIGYWENKVVGLCDKHLKEKIENDNQFARQFFKEMEQLNYTGEWKAIDLWNGED